MDTPPGADPKPSCQGGLAFCSRPDFTTSSLDCLGPSLAPDSPGSRALGLLNRLWRDSSTRVQRTYMIPHAWTDSPSSPTHSARSSRGRVERKHSEALSFPLGGAERSVQNQFTALQPLYHNTRLRPESILAVGLHVLVDVLQ